MHIFHNVNQLLGSEREKNVTFSKQNRKPTTVPAHKHGAKICIPIDELSNGSKRLVRYISSVNGNESERVCVCV